MLLESGKSYGFKGKYGFTDASVNESTGSVSSRAIFANPDRALLPGMYVRARVVAGVDPAAILVPQRAVSRNPLGQAVAMFVDKDGRIEQRTLDLGEDIDGNWLVRSGASPGDRLVVEGTQKARPGATVRTVEVSVDPATGLAASPTRQADARPETATSRQ